MAEYIFQSTDPTFEIATRAVAELTEQRRLEISYSRISGIDRVKSSRRNNLEFGNLYDFSRRVGLCARICMAHSLELNARAWRVGAGVYENHLDDDKNFHTDLTWGTRDQTLPDLSGRQSKYCSEYDRFYPHSIIENQLDPIQPGNHYFPSTMYIFLNDFTQIIQISTTIRVDDHGNNHEINPTVPNDGRFHCNINVVSIFANINAIGEGNREGRFVNFLQTLCRVYTQNLPHADINELINEVADDDNVDGDGAEDGGDDTNASDEGDAGDDDDEVDALARLIRTI